MAEREAFEPSIRFLRILTFQASAFDHSATAPHCTGGGSLSCVGALGTGMLYFPFHPMLDRAMPIRSLAFTAALFLSSPALAAASPATPSPMGAPAPADPWRPSPPSALPECTDE